MTARIKYCVILSKKLTRNNILELSTYVALLRIYSKVQNSQGRLQYSSMGRISFPSTKFLFMFHLFLFHRVTVQSDLGPVRGGELYACNILFMYFTQISCENL